MWLERFGGVCVAAGAVFAVAAEPTDSETVAFFESGAIPVLRLELSTAARQRLRDEPREYARCALVEDGKTVVARAAVKLKGAAGSYRDFDDRPSLTLKIDKYEKGGRWHGMQKFHLNNAVQDETYLCEWLGARLFRAAGYPAPLAGHVRLWIDDRDLGLYVLREGFDEPFLDRTFGAAEGTLYDGGFVQDLDEELEMDVGEDPDDRDDLVGLATACHEPDPAIRREAIEARLDLDRFLSFMALERICGHWDGYSLNRNNYRLWFPAAGRGSFLPHGMDQLFGDPEAGVFDHASPLVAAAVMQDDRWRDRYREKLGDLVRVVRPVDRWLGEVDACHDRIQAILADVDTEAAAAHRDRVAEFKERLGQRVDALDRLVAAGPEEPLAFAAEADGPLADWQPAPEAEDVRLEEEDVDGVPGYGVVRDAFGDHASSWRRQLLLPRGRYRFVARVRTEGVIPIPDDQAGGAGIRLAGTGRADEVVGTTPWRTLVQEFVVREDQRLVELILELRARRGRAWFDRESLRLERLGEP
jgi:hypothetical protein